METYEQKYKEALERARLLKLANPDDEAIQTFVKDSFPELRESEDERIRQGIVETIKQCTDILDPKNQKQMLAWLEKQKEHQNKSDAPNESSWEGIISSSDKDSNLDELAQDYVDGVKQYNPIPTWDLMQTAVCYGYHLGTNHQVLNDKHLLAAIQVQFGTHAKIENGKRYAKLTWDEFKKIVFELCSRGKQKEQKPAEWSEEDEYKLNFLTEMLDGLDQREFDTRYMKELSSWLKSLPERFNLQPKQEWSEEDKEMFDEALTGILLAKNRMNDTGCIGLAERFEKAYKWLESFRPRPHWKPSEEQKPEAKLTGWVARDRNGEIYVYGDYPEKDSERPIWIGSNSINLYQESFPDLKWENEPVEVEITIRKK